MTHREAIKEYLGSLKLKDQFVIDWGSGAKPVYRYLDAENCRFVTIDQNKQIVQDRRAPEHYEHDIQEPIEIGMADMAFCMEVLEHTTNPRLILANIFMNLKEGGTLHLSVPFMFPIHSEDDYLRYTAHGLTAILTQMGFNIEYLDNTVGEEGYIVRARK